MNYHVYRTHLSGYWDKNALEMEKISFDGVPGLKYHGLVTNPQDWSAPAILLSNTNFAPHQVESTNWKKIKLILHANSGFDNLIAPAFLDAYSEPLIFAPSLRAQAVAEYILQAWLQGLGPIPWVKSWDDARQFTRRLAKNENVLLIGFGHVGKAMAKIVHAMNADLTIYDPYVSEPNVLTDADDIEWNSFSTIIFCCALNDSSMNILKGDRWKKISPGAIIINAARGKLLDLKEVIAFAFNHPTAKIYLDVFPQEPWDKTMTFPNNVFCSSHIAGVHQQLLSETLRWQQEVLKDFFSLTLADFLKERDHENLRNRI